MIYVVSGYRRSGTSAMMSALKSSGFPYVSNSKLDEGIAKQPLIDGYRPTKDGLFEGGRRFYMSPNCIRSLSDGVAIKIFYDGLPTLPSGEYTIIFMQRDPAEIIKSLAMVEEYRRNYRQGPPPENDKYPFDVYGKYNPEDVQHCLDIAKQRKDINVIEVNFRDLMENPRREFTRLKVMGVPIMIDNAVNIIDPDWYRCVA